VDIDSLYFCTVLARKQEETVLSPKYFMGNGIGPEFPAPCRLAAAIAGQIMAAGIPAESLLC
jgi:hypothetical protein